MCLSGQVPAALKPHTAREPLPLLVPCSPPPSTRAARQASSPSSSRSSSSSRQVPGCAGRPTAVSRSTAASVPSAPSSSWAGGARPPPRPPSTPTVPRVAHSISLVLQTFSKVIGHLPLISRVGPRPRSRPDASSSSRRADGWRQVRASTSCCAVCPEMHCKRGKPHCPRVYYTPSHSPQPPTSTRFHRRRTLTRLRRGAACTAVALPGPQCRT